MIDDSKLVASLLEEGLADQASLDALRVGSKGGRSLYEALIRSKVVDEPKVVGVASKVLNVPMGHVPEAIPADILGLVPSSIARRNRAVPLGKVDAKTLVLAMANPTDELGRDEVAMHAGLTVEVVIIGPATLEMALEKFYPESAAEGDDAMKALDGFELSSFGEELPGEEWSDYFDDSQASVEDSAVLSRDMQDRPSTDVLAEELMDEAESLSAEDPDADLPEIEIIEELGQPIRKRPPSPYASLDSWEVDEAIVGSSIVSAEDAGSLFDASEADEDANPQPDDKPSEQDVANEEEDDVIDETSQLAMEPSEGHTDALDVHSKTSVGLGVEHLAEEGAGAARPKRKKRDRDDDTGKTELGHPRGTRTETGVADDEDGEDEEAKPDAPMDYAALGRAILRSKPKNDLPPEDTNVTEMEAVEKKSSVVALFEDDDEVMPKINSTTTHARGATPPSDEVGDEGGIEFPEDIDANGLAAALAALLVGKGILSVEELVSLARELTVKKG